jgi:hypothetical protein
MRGENSSSSVFIIPMVAEANASGPLFTVPSLHWSHASIFAQRASHATNGSRYVQYGACTSVVFGDDTQVNANMVWRKADSSNR